MSVKSFLDINGVSTFLNNLKNIFVGKQDIDNSLSSTSENPVQNKVINTALGNKVDKVSGKQLSTNDYTTTEKNKLAGIASGAEVNQNTFANVKVGSSTISADSKSDTLELVAGSNITITPDTTNDKVTITATNTTYNEATQSTTGLMSAEDKEKLDGIAEGANNYVHPSTHAASMITQDSTHRFVTDVEKQTYADKYTKNEVDNKLSALETKIDWKESVDTYDDIETTYPSPVDGWTVNVKDTDITYRYNGKNWIAISANSIPLATTSVDGRMSKTDKAKLDGIASGANKYTHPSYTSRTSGLYKITVDGSGHVSGATAVAKSDITALGIPSTNTTYSNATTSAAGLMSATDKSKLDGVASGAEVNQNAFSNVKVGSTTVAADAKTDTLELVAGSNVTITPDATNDKITIAATNTTYSTVTQSANGLMSSADKTKLDGIATGANNYTHPTTSGNKHIPSGGSSGQILRWSADGTAVWGADNNTTYSDMKGATSSANGAHGLVPQPDAGEQNKFLKGDGTWGTPTNTTYGAAGTSLGLVKSGGDVTISSGVITVNDDSHAHTIANIDGLQDALDGITAGSVTSASKWTTARNINGMSIDGSANRFNYGTCSTAAATAAKTVSCTGFTLATGSEITVKFTVTNTASNPTLNVNGTGAKAVYYNGAAISAGYLKANKTYTFRYNGTQYDLVGDIDTNTTYSLSSFGITATAAELNKLDGVTATATELNYVDGVTSNIQTQLNGKAASSHTHSGTQVTGLTASRALVSNSSGQVTVSAVTSTELGYLDGVTSAIQTQLNNKIATSNVTSTINSSNASKVPTSQAVMNYIDANIGGNVVVPVTASGFSLNSSSGRYEQTVTVSGLTSATGGIWDILRAGDVLSEAESKIAASITDVIRQDGSIKIACIEKPAQNFSLILYGTSKDASDDDTVLSNMGEWFTNVSNLMAEEKITAQKVVTSLPSDAASHPTTVYWIIES